MTFFVRIGVLLRFLINTLIYGLKSRLKYIEDIIYEILNFILKFLGYPSLLLACNVNSGSSNNDHINYFSDENPENNNNEGFNSNPNGDSNTDDDSNPDEDNSEDSDYEEVENHNAPEEVMKDLDMVDKAKNNDPEALEYLAKEYRSFFEDNTKEEALKDLEEYLENEFPGELRKSNFEADADEARDEAEINESIAEALKKEAEGTHRDLRRKTDLEEAAEEYQKVAEAASKKAEEAISKANGTWKSPEEREAELREFEEEVMDYEAGENIPQSEDSISENENELKDNSKRPLAEEEEERKTKRKKTDDGDNNDGNSSGGGAGPSGPFPSDPGPSNSSGGNFSKILVILGGVFETIWKVIEDIILYL